MVDLSIVMLVITRGSPLFSSPNSPQAPTVPTSQAPAPQRTPPFAAPVAPPGGNPPPPGGRCLGGHRLRVEKKKKRHNDVGMFELMLEDVQIISNWSNIYAPNIYVVFFLSISYQDLIFKAFSSTNSISLQSNFGGTHWDIRIGHTSDLPYGPWNLEENWSS